VIAGHVRLFDVFCANESTFNLAHAPNNSTPRTVFQELQATAGMAGVAPGGCHRVPRHVRLVLEPPAIGRVIVTKWTKRETRETRDFRARPREVPIRIA
jgi:hypothetical protein